MANSDGDRKNIRNIDDERTNELRTLSSKNHRQRDKPKEKKTNLSTKKNEREIQIEDKPNSNGITEKK